MAINLRNGFCEAGRQRGLLAKASVNGLCPIVLMSLPRRILISRTDAIGDVILTLPVATILKQHFPESHIGFLGKKYTQPVIDCCSSIDEFIDAGQFLSEDPRAIHDNGRWDSIIHVFPCKDIAIKAWQASLPLRIGTSSRPYHWLTCNKLIKLSRRHSQLHEAQLNTRLLAPFGITSHFTTEDLGRRYAFDKIPPLPSRFSNLLRPGMRHIILHPKSQGSAREWGLDQFTSLIRLLPEAQFRIFISGTAAEKALLGPLFDAAGDRIIDISGQMDLATFISFINACDALVAASTGPLHIAAALGRVAIGLYPAIRPMHAGRWGPLGPGAIAFALPDECAACRHSPQDCVCIRGVSAAEVAQHLMKQLE